MTFVSAWLVLGIGADDIFVFLDTWKQSKMLTLGGAGRRAPVEHRLSWTFREAGFAMLITTTTTAAAFFGSALSSINVIRQFG
jgi:predicted RND superfamily exporter protein